MFGPPSLGPAHGDFLRERLFALGLVTAVPLLASGRSARGRVASFLFFAAFIVQTCYVWEYGAFSTRRIAGIMDARSSLGRERSILGHIVKEESKFRASPDQHALTLLGVDTGSVIWNNYEADLYYFPVRFRETLSACDRVTMNPLHFVNIDGLSERRTVEVRAFLCLARKNRSRLDTLVVQGLGDKLDPWLPGWRARQASGDVRIYQ